MKKLFTSFAIMMFAVTSVFAQTDWQKGQEVTAELQWQDYTGKSNDAGVWVGTGGYTYNFQEWEMFSQAKGVEFAQIFWLPAGCYEFTCQGFYRGDYQVPYWEENEEINAVLFGESVTLDEETGEVTEVTRTASTPLLSIASSENSFGRLFTTTEWTNDVAYTHDGVEYYVPNCMEGTRIWFDAGYYQGNKVKVIHIQDGYFKIGIRKTAARDGDWCIFDNFQAYYVGDAGEEAQLEVAREEFQNAMIAVDAFRKTLEESGYIALLGYYENEMVELEDASSEYTTVDEFNEGVKQLNALVIKYRPYLTAAKNLSTLIASCETLAETAYPGLADFQAAIQAAKNVESDELSDDGVTGVYTTTAADYAAALTALQQARAAYIGTKPTDKPYQDMSGVIAYPFFCQPEYNPEWSEENNRWEPIDLVLNGNGELLGWSDLGESGGDDDNTRNTTTRIAIGKGVNIGSDETVTGEWYQVNTTGYEPYWNHKLSSAKQWNLPRSEMEIAQNLTGLPEGYYSIQGCGITWTNDWSGNCRMGIRITSGDTTVESQEETYLSGWWNYSLDDWTYYTTDMIHVTDGTARVAFFANGFSSFTGMQLYYYGENPDFTTLIQEQLDKIDPTTLTLKGDQAAVQEILNSISMPIVGFDAYSQALETIAEAKNYITTATDYLNSHDVTTLFADLQEKYAEDPDTYEYLGTAVFYTFDLYEKEDATYKDIQECVADYNAYLHYLDALTRYATLDDATIKATIAEQASELKDNYAVSATLAEYEKALSIAYNAAVIADLNLDEATPENPVDVTALLVNPSFTQGTKGWTGSFVVDGELQNAECYSTNFRVEQTLYGLPAGKYTVKVKSFYRDGYIDAAYDHIYYMDSGEYNPYAKLFANSNETGIVSICNEDATFTERSYTEYTFKQASPELDADSLILRAWCTERDSVDADGYFVEYIVTSWRQDIDEEYNIIEKTVNDAWIYDAFIIEGDERFFYPNSMRGAYNRFLKDNGAYDNEVSTIIGNNGTLNFGLYKDTTITGDWCMFDNFQFFYLGAATLPGDVNEDGEVDIKDVVAIINHIAGTDTYENANVNGDTDEEGNAIVDINDVVAVINIMAGN